jgi:hypothetical protein
MNVPAAASRPRQHLGLVVLRVLALLGLVIGLALVVDLLLLKTVPAFQDAFAGLFDWNYRAPDVDPGVLVELTVTGLFIFLGFAVLRWCRPRSWRHTVMLGLGAATLGVTGLSLMAWSPTVLDGFRAFLSLFLRYGPGEWKDPSLTALIVLVGLVPLMILFVIWWRRLYGWRWIGGGYLALAPVLVYLAIDDGTIWRPVTMDQLVPPFPGAEQSYAVLMRYGRQHPLGRDFHFQPPNRIYQSAGVFAPGGNASEWSAWLKGNRVDLEADWRELSPVWAWWNELNAFDRIGDLTPATADAEMVAFAPIRAVTQHACAIASLQALDGRGEEAFATLLPVVEVSRKLESESRTLVRMMIARTTQGMALATAGFVLDHAAVSSAAQARFATALTGGVGGAAGARRIFAMPYAWWISAASDHPVGDLLAFDTRNRSVIWQAQLNLLSPLLYNPRHTANAIGELMTDLEDYAGRREAARVDPAIEAFFVRENRRFKNRLGTVLVSNMVATAYTSAIQSYWKVEDARAALRQRLVADATR